MATRSSHPALSNADSFAVSSTDTLMLVGRVLLGWLFLTAGWGKFANVAGTTAYITNLGIPAPEAMTYLSGVCELIIGITLILGLATRYGAVLCFVYVLIVTAIAHRYWQYPAAQQVAQYNSFLKNLAIMGGALYVLAFGAGRYSVDASLAKK